MRKWWLYRWISDWAKQYCIAVWDYPNRIVEDYNNSVKDKEYAMIGLAFLWFMFMIVPLFLVLTPIVFIANVGLTLFGKLITLIVSLIRKLRQH